MACSVIILAGPLVALLYAVIVWGMFVATYECHWTDKLVGHVFRMALVGVAVGCTMMLQETEHRTQQYKTSTLVVGCMGLNMAVIVWGMAGFFIYQTRTIDVLGSLTLSISNDKSHARNSTKLHGKVVLITGANTGIGKETARQLAQLGATVIMACRSVARAQEAIQDIVRLEHDEEQARTASGVTRQKQHHHQHHIVTEDQFLVLPIDLGDLESIRQAVQLLDHDNNKSDLKANNIKNKQFIFERSKLPSTRIDVLINNAGVMMGTKTLSKDGYELMMQANHLGHFLLTNLLLPKLLPNDATTSSSSTKNTDNDDVKDKNENVTSTTRPAPARILCISSSTYAFSNKTGFDFDDMFCDKSHRRYTLFGQYSMTKLANILMAKELSRRYDPSVLQVFSVHPGIVRTDVTRNFPWYLQVLNDVFAYFVAACQKSPAEGAYTSVHCATAAVAAESRAPSSAMAVTGGPLLPPNGSFVVNCRAYPTLACADSVAVRYTFELFSAACLFGCLLALVPLCHFES
jgi:retinol dehydrogenase 12